MQNFQQTPIFSDVADWFCQAVLTDGKNEFIEIPAAFSSRAGYLTTQSDHYFLFSGFFSTTNYDNAGRVFTSANTAATLITPQVPNNFTVQMERASSNNYSNSELTQAEFASAGMYSGKQNPYPIIYSPSITLKFQFTDLTGFFLLDEADDPVPLVIQTWMQGYTIPVTEWGRFLETYPALQATY